MHIFLLGFYSSNNTLIKKRLFLIALLLCVSRINAQVSVRIEPGILLANDSSNIGLLLNVEPQVNTSEKTMFGLRFGIAINPQKIKIDPSSPFFIDDLDDNGIVSFVPTLDYYWTENYYRPYIGLGLGYYLFSDIDVVNRNDSSNVLVGSVNNQLGFLVRGGLEWGNIRVGLEYNFIPKADIEIPTGQIIGTVDNSYLGLSIGFTIGAGKISI